MSNQEDKKCRGDRRPFYTVAEAAVNWCNIQGRKINIGEDGIPLEDRINPCLRARALEIMFAIDEGILRCGRDGKNLSADDQVAKPRRTVTHGDLKEWMIRNFPDSKPAFLFDEIERNTHSAITVDAYRALKASTEAKQARIADLEEKLRMLNSQMMTIESERDALRGQVSSFAPIATRERRTMLVVIAALCNEAKLSPYERGCSKKIADATQKLGASVSDDTINNILHDITDALESHMK